jgi:hypothetical protein
MPAVIGLITGALVAAATSAVPGLDLPNLLPELTKSSTAIAAWAPIPVEPVVVSEPAAGLVPIPAAPMPPVRLPAPVAKPTAPPSEPEPEVRRTLGSSYAFPPTRGDSLLYVSTGGSDQNSGTRGAPFRTIERAAAAAKPGTTVLVADGTYRGAFSTSVSGRADARISFVAENKWAVKLVGGGGPVWQNNGNYVDIQGFDISGSAADGIIQSGSFGRILDNRVHGLSEGCIATNNDEYTMVDNDIIGNVVFGCGTNQLHHGIYPGGPGGTISNNIAFGNAGFGIHCWHNCNKQVITNNLLFDNGEGGILIGQGDNPNNGDVAADSMLVANNIVIDNRGGAGIRESGTTGSRNRYLNNQVFGNASGGIGLQSGSASGTITAPPTFVDFRADGSGDYRLRSGSPGLGAGSVTGAPAIDIVGTPRQKQNGGIDLGPFQH